MLKMSDRSTPDVPFDLWFVGGVRLIGLYLFIHRSIRYTGLTFLNNYQRHPDVPRLPFSKYCSPVLVAVSILAVARSRRDPPSATTATITSYRADLFLRAGEQSWNICAKSFI